MLLGASRSNTLNTPKPPKLGHTRAPFCRADTGLAHASDNLEHLLKVLRVRVVSARHKKRAEYRQAQRIGILRAGKPVLNCGGHRVKLVHRAPSNGKKPPLANCKGAVWFDSLAARNHDITVAALGGDIVATASDQKPRFLLRYPNHPIIARQHIRVAAQ